LIRLISLTELCWVLATVTCLAVPGAAFGQRADENAVTAAQDAFGTRIGFQNVGLYSPNEARGFSPQQAGNLRIEGLYFDQQTWVTGDCMVRETTMRVGIAAQSYSFPAPTGIADLSLRTPGDKTLISAVLTRGPFNAATADLEAQIPLTATLDVDLCAGYRKDFDVDVFRDSHTGVFGTTFRWRPTSGTEIIPFWSYIVGGARQIVPSVYTDGNLPLPLFRTQDLGTQDWTTWGWHQTTFGVVVKSALGDSWALAAGLFIRWKAIRSVTTRIGLANASDGRFSDGCRASLYGQIHVGRIATVSRVHERRPLATAPARGSRPLRRPGVWRRFDHGLRYDRADQSSAPSPASPGIRACE
jgi:iron complex outermembrane receptor protein